MKKFARRKDVIEHVRENAVLTEPIVSRDRFTMVTVSCLVTLWRKDGTTVTKVLEQTEISEWAPKYGLPLSEKTGYDVAWGRATKELAKRVWASQKSCGS